MKNISCENAFYLHDSEDDYRTGCRNVRHCQQQQSYSGFYFHPDDQTQPTFNIIIISMALHLASLWSRGLEQLANGVLFCSCLQLTSIEVNFIITYEMFLRHWWFVTLTSWSRRLPSLFTKDFRRKTGILLGELIGWFSIRTRTSFDDGKARGKD